MEKKYRMIVRDHITSGRICTDADLEHLNCIYKSPVFLTDGSLAALGVVIDFFHKEFDHFIDWAAIVVEAE